MERNGGKGLYNSLIALNRWYLFSWILLILKDRDQLEEIDLSNHLLKEPVPKKIDDFRGHPLYVLDRHLRRNEVLRPGATPVGALTSGKGMNLKTENIFKRRDVMPCYSTREWFRKGRIVKVFSPGA
jgi:xeroderma pigmentosum group C-complementing protein